MWYQSVSARSMPPARLPSVGTIHPATTAATAATSATAIVPTAGDARAPARRPGPARGEPAADDAGSRAATTRRADDQLGLPEGAESAQRLRDQDQRGEPRARARRAARGRRSSAGSARAQPDEPPKPSAPARSPPARRSRRGRRRTPSTPLARRARRRRPRHHRAAARLLDHVGALARRRPCPRRRASRSAASGPSRPPLAARSSAFSRCRCCNWARSARESRQASTKLRTGLT